jgi:hypothetical protein
VELEKSKRQKMFELKPTGSQPKSKGGVFSKGRLLLGRTESCDLMVNHDSVSAVHAVMDMLQEALGAGLPRWRYRHAIEVEATEPHNSAQHE